MMAQVLDNILVETIYEVIRNVFEDDIAEVILRYLNENCSRKMDDRVKIFADSLPKVLGTGSVIIEDLILETLHSKLGMELRKKEGYGFSDYIVEMRKKLERDMNR